MKKLLPIVCGVLVVITLIIIYVVIVLIGPTLVLPENGVWFCEDLQIQLNFESANLMDSYIVLDGEKYQCRVGSDPGSSYFGISYTDYNPLSKHKLYFTITYRDETTFIVKPQNDEQTYTFSRIN